MPMRARELDLKRSITGDARNPSFESLYHVTGIAAGQNEDDVIAFLCDVSTGPLDPRPPKFVTFRVPNSFANPLISPQTVTTKLHLLSIDPAMIDHSQATALVRYGLQDAAPSTEQGGERKDKSESETEILGPEYSFDTQGGTQHITQSLQTRHSVKAGGGDGPNFRGAIGVSRDKVEGCDIATGDLKWSVTVKGVPVSIAYLRKLKTLTGKINDRIFYGREEHELLFLGASGSFRAGDGWVVTYNFHESENFNEEQSIGDVPFPSIKGHDYVWFVYEERTEDTFSVQIPSAGFVEQVYRKRDMRQLFMEGDYDPDLPVDP